jgi:D-sedoheptulose 7-phosphate isomerase
LENFAREGDLLVAISASGNSPNLIRAVELARTRGVATIGMLGFDGGRLRSLVEEAVWVQSEAGAYELVEDAHLVLCHVLTRSLVADTAATPASFLEKTIFA